MECGNSPGHSGDQQAREALFQPLRLRRSRDSKTHSIRYHGNTSRIFGRGPGLGIYVDRKELPTVPPEEIEAMVYYADPGSASENVRVYELRFSPVQAEETFRYDGTGGWNQSTGIGTVYLPKKMFPQGAPDRCWLEIRLPEPGRMGR